MGITTFNRLAAYLVLNISSPNTPGLRTLQQGDELDDLLARAMEARSSAALTDGRAAPLLVKFAPDLTDPQLETIAGLALKHRVDGLIIGNTTLTRPNLHGPYATESGGLSGRPLFALSTRVLARMYRLVGQALPLIGVGGISSPEDAWVKITAGASLIQLYSALIYQGPGLVRDIHLGLIPGCTKRGMITLRLSWAGTRRAGPRTSNSREPATPLAGSPGMQDLDVALEEAGLIRIDPADMPIRRQRAGLGFTYLDESGRTISQRRTRTRIGELVIPPAWTEVRIASDLQAHLQAVGRDEAGRLQYIYHAAWEDVRAHAKAQRLKWLGQVMPDLRARVVAALEAPISIGRR